MIKKRIVYVTTTPETVVSILNDQCIYLNDQFDFMVVTGRASSFNLFFPNELKWHRISLTRSLNPFKDLAAIIELIVLLKRIRPDVVHSFTPKAGFVSAISAFLCSVEFRVHTFTGLLWPTLGGFRRFFFKLFDEFIILLNTSIIAESNGVKSDLESLSIKKEIKIIGKGNIAGVDTVRFKSENFELNKSSRSNLLNIGEDKFVFIFVGRLNKDKGVKELYDAFYNLSQNAFLLIVGELDKSNPISNDLLRCLSSHPRIILSGYQRDIRPFLKASNILVLPSYREGFPNVLLQANSMGLPLIASDVNGSRELIRPGFNGWLIRSRDRKDLELFMRIALRTSDSKLKQMGHNGRKMVCEYFDRKEHLERMKSFYINL